MRCLRAMDGAAADTAEVAGFVEGLAPPLTGDKRSGWVMSLGA